MSDITVYRFPGGAAWGAPRAEAPVLWSHNWATNPVGIAAVQVVGADLEVTVTWATVAPFPGGSLTPAITCNADGSDPVITGWGVSL